METRKFDIPQGFILDSVNIEKQEYYIKPFSWQDITSFDAVLLAAKKDRQQFEKECENLEDDEIAYKQLKLIVKVINQGWVADWDNGNQKKWWLWYYLGENFRLDSSLYCYLSSDAPSRLWLETKEKVLHLDEYFQDILKRYLNS